MAFSDIYFIKYYPPRVVQIRKKSAILNTKWQTIYFYTQRKARKSGKEAIMNKRFLAVLLCLCIAFSLMPSLALAVEPLPVSQPDAAAILHAGFFDGEITVSYGNTNVFAPLDSITYLTAIHNIPTSFQGELSYQWYSTETGYIGTATMITGAVSSKYCIPASKTGVTYYFCVVTNTKGGETNSSYSSELQLVKVTITDGSSSYVLPFTDVPTSAWYRRDLEIAHKNGLIEGRLANSFVPAGNMTETEAIVLAARMHQRYTTGTVTLENGNGSIPWYQPYVDYAYSVGIIDFDTIYDHGRLISRQEFVYIFYNVFPVIEYYPINHVADNAIPDVKFMSTAIFPPRIYTFYRAGILIGSTPEGHFLPEANIRRDEVAAILTRLFYPSARQPITLS